MKAPTNWDEDVGPCLDLEILDTDDGHGSPVMISAWQFEKGELEKLAAGAPLFLRIYGTAHPVVSVFAGEPEQQAS